MGDRVCLDQLVPAGYVVYSSTRAGGRENLYANRVLMRRGELLLEETSNLPRNYVTFQRIQKDLPEKMFNTAMEILKQRAELKGEEIAGDLELPFEDLTGEER
ncbi:MAG: hypothetical protein WC548_04515 [Candidatus Pacearchaeota archaeon]